jgi:hypothetical protein
MISTSGRTKPVFCQLQPSLSWKASIEVTNQRSPGITGGLQAGDGVLSNKLRSSDSEAASGITPTRDESRRNLSLVWASPNTASVHWQ